MDLPRDLRVLSLCSGIGGLDLGIRGAVPSARTVALVEREAFACAVLATLMEAGLMDPAPIHTDLATFDGAPWRGAVDLVAAGFSCQPWSYAGERRGVEDERWIWPLVERVVRDVGPPFVFLENVPGLIGGGLEYVLGGLASLGFDAVWDVFSAAESGATHERERFYLLAHRDGLWEPQRSEREVVGRDLDGGEATRSLVANANRGAGGLVAQRERDGPQPGPWDAGASLGSRGDGRRVASDARGSRPGPYPRPWPPGRPLVVGDSSWLEWRDVVRARPDLEPSVRRVAHGIPGLLDDRLDRVRALGNAVVPTTATLALLALWRRLWEGA